MSITGLKLWLVDAFATSPFTGNPAGVAVVDEFPDVSLMQSIAAELNWSETSFVKPLGNNQYHIRWFSPMDEAPMCGHATLAAAHILWEQGFCHHFDRIIFESKAGMLSVERTDNGWIRMSFPSIELFPCALTNELKNALGDVAIDSVFQDKLICVAVLSDPQELINLKPNLQIIEELPYRAVSVTANGLRPYDFISRYFAPKVGIPEDPVCGSAHCRLGPFWAQILGKRDLQAYQASARGGLLRLHVDDQRTFISGKAVTVCEGELRLGEFLNFKKVVNI